MKNLINLFAVILITTISVSSQDSMQQSTTVKSEPTCTLTLELIDLASDEGQLMVGLYNSEGTWLGNSMMGEVAEIVGGKATVVFENVPYGIYAASAVHDQDMNEKLNTGLFGIPSEPYASSRGAIGRFGPPKWEDAKFTLDSSATTEQIKF